jgi:hypothetical protein
MKKPLKIMVWIFIAVFGIAFYNANQKDTERNAAIEAPSSPTELVRPALNNPDAQVTETEGALDVDYFQEDMTNWLITKGFTQTYLVLCLRYLRNSHQFKPST